VFRVVLAERRLSLVLDVYAEDGTGEDAAL